MKQDRKEKSNVPNLRFPEFEGEWKWHKLGDIATLNKGSGISKEQLSKYGRPCILYGELYTKYKSEVIYDILSRTNIDMLNPVNSKANDVIIPSSGEAAIDIATARCVPFDNILLGGDLNIIRLHNNNGQFFSYQLNGARKREIAKVAQGVSVVHLYGENLRKLKVTTCSIEEQDKIAQFLSLLDQRIETQSKIIKELKKLKTALVDELYASPSGSTRLRFKEFQKSWMQTNLGSITQNFNRRNKNKIVYPMFSVTNNSGFIAQTEKFGDREMVGEDVGSYKIVNLGEFAYNPARINVGSIARYNGNESCMISSLYVCFRLKNDISSDWALHLLKSRRMNFYYGVYGEGGVRVYLFYPNFARIKVSVPDLLEQEKIGTILSAIDKRIDLAISLNDKYQQQKAFFLRKMFI